MDWTVELHTEDGGDVKIIDLPNFDAVLACIKVQPTDEERAAVIVAGGMPMWGEHGLGSVEIHRELMTAAARWIMAWKLWSVLSARIAVRLNSLSLQKKFSMR